MNSCVIQQATIEYAPVMCDVDQGIRVIHFSAPSTDAVENKRQDIKEVLTSAALYL